jgi:type IV fimbrial biogenesis protein FimT
MIELLVTLAVAAILATIAVPNFQNFMTTNRVVSLTNELVAALNYARSEAIKRGVPVTVCKTADPNVTNPVCSTSGGWQTGWVIFTDGGTRGTIDGSDSRLRIKQPPGGNATIAPPSGDTNFADFLSYLPSGESLGGGNSSDGKLSVCLSGTKRDIVISAPGRIRIEKGTC